MDLMKPRRGFLQTDQRLGRPAVVEQLCSAAAQPLRYAVVEPAFLCRMDSLSLRTLGATGTTCQF